VVVYVFLVASIAMTAAIAGGPETFTFEGYADAAGKDWLVHRVPVPESGTLEAELSWSDRAADLNVFIKAPDGRQLARTNGRAHPEVLAIEASTTGTYTVAVKAVKGAANYVLDVTYTPSGNRPPVAGPDAADVTSSRPGVSIDVLANDADPDGDPLRVDAVRTPLHGSAKLRRDLTILYVPDIGYAGEDRFTYRVCDAAIPHACADGTVTLTVGDPNHPPIAEPDHAATDADHVTVDVLANDSDPDGDWLTIERVGEASGGDVAISGGKVDYDADPAFNGTDTFSYRVCDDATTTACTEADVTVEVGDPGGPTPPSDTPPNAVEDRARTEAGAAVVIDVLANDTDAEGDALFVASATDGAAGSTEITAEGSVRYRPSAFASADDTFTYVACEVDARDLCDRATVEVFNAWLERVDLQDPITIDLHVGPDLLRLDDARDYILRMPDAKKTGVLEIRGGRNISIVGGYMSVASPGPNISISDGPNAVAGRIVHIEGVLIDGSSGAESDGIKINAPRTTVQVKNVRIVGLRGTLDTLHADLIQPWGGVGELRINGFTGASRYNSLYLRRENDPLMPPIGTVRIQRTNIFGYLNPGGSPDSTLRGISIGTQSSPPSDATQTVNCRMTHPMYLDGFFIEPPGTKRLGQFVYPHDRMQTAGCAAEVAADGRSVDWPALRDMVSGVVQLGPPPGGDFVPDGMAGLGYRG
jgi:hypothetical protein